MAVVVAWISGDDSGGSVEPSRDPMMKDIFEGSFPRSSYKIRQNTQSNHYPPVDSPTLLSHSGYVTESDPDEESKGVQGDEQGLTAYNTLHLPPLPPSLYIPPPVDRRDDILESEQPPRKRFCLSTIGSRYKVGESSTARPTRGRGIDYGFVSTVDAEGRRQGIRDVGYYIRDSWEDPAEAVPEIAPMTVREVNTRVTELAELHEHDTQDLYALLEDAQDSTPDIAIGAWYSHSDTSPDTVMSDSEDSTVTYTAVSSPFEDGSDIGSPRVDGPPIMPEDPYAYIMAAYQVPPSPDYIHSPEEPQSPPPLDFVPEPMYPEYIPQGEEQPLPAATSPTADSPGYVPESNPEEESEEDDEDPEEDPADYPADKDDDDDDDEDEDEDEEEEEHPASACNISHFRVIVRLY
ncbi:hypothetical protein Tco_0942012 [Tanacetum coccineum]|uniref:Uncharacterized protein n=1 Tax=Tanacetum coccineum TaxID=301880 RepID=A0ABQ5DSI4_9ASTR